MAAPDCSRRSQQECHTRTPEAIRRSTIACLSKLRRLGRKMRAAYATRSYVDQALFAVGTASMILLFVGIHNAWDTVTYLVLQEAAPRPSRPNSDQPL